MVCMININRLNPKNNSLETQSLTMWKLLYNFHTDLNVFRKNNKKKKSLHGQSIQRNYEPTKV